MEMQEMIAILEECVYKLDDVFDNIIKYKEHESKAEAINKCADGIYEVLCDLKGDDEDEQI